MTTSYGLPVDQYHCRLDEQPHYLVPPRLLNSRLSDVLLLNRSCWLSWHGPRPSHVAGSIQHPRFLPSAHIAWVTDPATGAVWPYWIGPEYASYLHNAVPGRRLPSMIPEHVRWILNMAGILVPPDHMPRRKAEWSSQLTQHTWRFRDGLVALSDLVPPLHVGALRRYFRSLVFRNRLDIGDSQVERRYVAHNEPVTSFIHRQITQSVSAIAGVKVKPSYSYVAAYQGGAALKPHIDREQCEYSLTMCIDATPEPSQQSLWPIYLETSKGRVGVWQYIGDGLLYRGRHLPHYRPRLPRERTATSLLFHYVDESFGGPLN